MCPPERMKNPHLRGEDTEARDIADLVLQRDVRDAPTPSAGALVLLPSVLRSALMFFESPASNQVILDRNLPLDPIRARMVTVDTMPANVQPRNPIQLKSRKRMRS